MEGEDWRTKRVCVSTSVDGALTALLSYDSEPFGKHMFVHMPEGIDLLESKHKICTPSKDKLPDVEVTGERWLKCPVKMRCIGEIEVIDLAPEQVSYDFRGQKMIVDRFVWKWVWMKKDV